MSVNIIMKELTFNASKIERIHGTVCDNVLEKLRENIILRKFQPGSRLLEANLASDFKVSRGSIRVALQSLINEGIIEETPEGHKIVLEITRSTIENMYELREWLELKAVDTLVNSGSIRYSQLLGILSQIEQDDPNRTVEDYYKLDILFHKTILQISNNRAILQAWDTMSSVIYTLLSINTSNEYEERYMREFNYKHKSIFDLIILRDKKCLNLMAQHIEDAKMLTLGLMDEIDKGSFQ